ncbi:Gmad2 immunoglobulin-like domain-containing protein [Jiangella endophytica]|uniref:Gmad2 immunoglobulin-like domain-containing protein n=1 Tax=Jiangella endophytica TaxID=1623398 RepID=UPI000E347E3F|nr:Gmad2 immunoglobulin-like domain-containing protein [Jiangella endophytica]
MSTPEDWTPEEQQVHDALHRAAERVQPGPDGLARIRRRTAVVPMWRRPVVLGLAGATALAAAVIVGGAIVLSNDDDDTPVATTTSTSPATSPNGTPTDTSPPTSPPAAETTPPAQTLTVPVYYVADAGDGLRLVREFHTVETSLPPVAAAINEMLTAPPADPDYTTLWEPGVEVLSADVADGAIVVDLSGPPAVGDDPDLATQQLVYTATAAAATAQLDGSLPVRIAVGGENPSEPVGRADPLEVRQLVQLNDPAEGATLPSPVTVSGEAAVNEANVLWELRRDGEVVDSGNTTAEECCTFSPFAFELDLEPGSYEIVVSESDESGGEGRPPMSDSRTFTVE